MFDIAGTMWLVTILFVYGLKSIWLRRSNVTTGAQGMGTRFGSGRDATLCPLLCPLYVQIATEWCKETQRPERG